MLKITHDEIDKLNSLLDHPGWKILVSIVKSKVDDLSIKIDTLAMKKKELTKPRETTYNITEVTILRKAFLNEVVGLPEEITNEYKWDQNVANANRKLEERYTALIQD